ncbi:MAG: hypothetical protein ABIJ46_00590 [bacterium]
MSDQSIRKLAAAAAVVCGLAVAVFGAMALGLFPDRWFWSDFFAQLLAVGTVAAAAALLLPTYLSYIRRPRFGLELPDDVRLSRYLDGRIKGTVRLVVRNDGRQAVRNFVWHLFLPKGLNAQVTEVAPYGKRKTVGTSEVGGLVYVHGTVEDELILPQTSFELPVRVWCDTADSRGEWQLQFGLHSEHGPFPAALGLHRSMDEATAADCVPLTVRFADGAGSAEAVKDMPVDVRPESPPQS